jgi:folate-binding protein YgfZ
LDNQYALLEQEALLHLSGPDSLQFLQGQVTCDTRQVNVGNARPGAYCTPQGRVVCDFLLCQPGEQHFALRMRRDLIPTSAEVFGKYIIFSKAELDAGNDDWEIFGCWGHTVAEPLRDLFGELPNIRYGAVRGDGFCVVQTDDQGQRYECYLQRSRQPDRAGQLRSSLEAASEAAWQLIDIDNGIARLQAATSGEFVPQMLNYDLTGHVSFSKGCYTGQEVVARLHYRGTPKRRLYRVELPRNTRARPGEPLFGNGEQSVGNLVNRSERGEQAPRGLAVATVAALDDGLHLQSADGPALEILDLPYDLASD